MSGSWLAVVRRPDDTGARALFADAAAAWTWAAQQLGKPDDHFHKFLSEEWGDGSATSYGGSNGDASVWRPGADEVCPSCSRPQLDAPDEMAAELARVTQERDEARARIHEAVDECQRRYATMQSEHDKLRALMTEARRLHTAEMEAQGKPGWAHISGYGAAAAASILGDLAAMRDVVAKARAVVDAFRGNGTGARVVAPIRILAAAFDALPSSAEGTHQ